MAKRLNEQSERRRGLAPAGIIEVIAGIGRAPILEHALQAALRDMGRCDILRHIGQTEPGQRRIEHLERAVEDELAFDAHVQIVVAFLELPGGLRPGAYWKRNASQARLT